MKKVYIIMNTDREVICATLSRDKAKQMLIDNSDLESAFLDEYDEYDEEDEEELSKKVDKDFEEWCENVLNNNEWLTDMYGVWCEVADLVE